MPRELVHKTAAREVLLTDAATCRRASRFVFQELAEHHRPGARGPGRRAAPGEHRLRTLLLVADEDTADLGTVAGMRNVRFVSIADLDAGVLDEALRRVAAGSRSPTTAPSGS